MDKGKWIVRAASLMILLAFFFPSVVVSCSGSMGMSQSLSLSDFSSQLNQSILYLLPVVSVFIIVLTFIKAGSLSQQAALLWGQLGLLVLGFIVTIGSIISLSNQIQGGSYGLFKVTPTYGAFIILASVIAFVVGWVMQKQAVDTSPVAKNEYYPQPFGGAPPEFQPAQEFNVPVNMPIRQPTVRGTNLEVVEGDLPSRRIFIQDDNFTIGRSSENLLHLPDPVVSRIHACLRHAQGMWFLQDQESSGGTFVNGVKTQAIRLNEGDEIAIGPFRFIFHSEN